MSSAIEAICPSNHQWKKYQWSSGRSFHWISLFFCMVMPHWHHWTMSRPARFIDVVEYRFFVFMILHIYLYVYVICLYNRWKHYHNLINTVIQLFSFVIMSCDVLWFICSIYYIYYDRYPNSSCYFQVSSYLGLSSRLTVFSSTVVDFSFSIPQKSNEWFPIDYPRPYIDMICFEHLKPTRDH